MNDQKRSAMQMALEALESAPVQYDFNSYPMLVMTPDTLQTTLTALREALASKTSETCSASAQPQDNLNCKSVQARLATSWGYVKAQPQGEPVAWVNVIDSDDGPYDFHEIEKLPKGKHHLYTSPPSVEAAIEATKEKAAKVCEEFTADMRHQSKEAYSFALECAAAIRGMK